MEYLLWVKYKGLNTKFHLLNENLYGLFSFILVRWPLTTVCQVLLMSEQNKVHGVKSVRDGS